MSADPDQLRIDPGRLMGRLADLAAIGAIEGTAGAARLAFTDADREGRDLVVAWMADLGLEVTVDAIGNVVGLWRPAAGPEASSDGDDPRPVMMGSHIDTVRTGGRYDGNYGVLAGLEVIETLQEAGVPLVRPLAVAFFSNEEGARYHPDMLGSLVYVGGMPLEEALDQPGIDGTVLGEELRRIGYQGPAPCPGPAPHAYLELHIEQGPVLEAEGFRIGAVTGVQGIWWTEATVTGQSNHAGTTPMALRHDAGYAAARIAVGVRELVSGFGPPLVGTVGSLRLHPDLVNVVPGSATLTVDLRHTDDATLVQAHDELEALLARVAAEEGVTVETTTLARFPPVAFDPELVALVESTATRLGATTMRLPSGAGHDAQMLARVCPTAMIFTPSHRGISHNPAEHTDPADLEAGANVLLQAVLRLAGASTAAGAFTAAGAEPVGVGGGPGPEQERQP